MTTKTPKKTTAKSSAKSTAMDIDLGNHSKATTEGNSNSILASKMNHNLDILNNKEVVPNPHNFITLRGAREHNLKDVSLVIPKNQLVVFTGLSGSGKSSLVFDTIYAEGQRRYIESLSSYARQFLGMKEKPALDSIDGLSPAISIDQKSTSHNPRSTVGTTTEIYDYIRILYAKAGDQKCPICGSEIADESVTKMVNRILKTLNGETVVILSPLINDQKGQHKACVIEARNAGFRRMRIDGRIWSMQESEKIELNKNERHSVEIVVDRIVISSENKQRLVESMETALKHGKEKATILKIDDEGEEQLFHFNKTRACINGHGNPGEPEARLFSFNSPHGACPTCTGLGHVTQIDALLIIPNPDLSINEGCIRPLSKMTITGSWLKKMFEDMAEKYDFSLNTPWKNLTKKQQDVILHGKDKFEGVISNLQRRYHETTSDMARKDIESYMTKKTCPDCKGSRLQKGALSVFLAKKNVADVVSMPIVKLLPWFESLLVNKNKELNPQQYEIAKLAIKEVCDRLKFLSNVGLSYLSIGRSSDTLSGGEAQRIRLATQIGSGLTGVLYILDEPSIGLHQRDNTKLLTTLKGLRDLGNTVLVVEHDEETMREADFLVDVGPKAGINGGQIVSIGTPAEVMADPNSPTGRFLSGTDSIPLPKKRRKISPEQKYIKITGANENNLKDASLEIPLGKLVCITGVSGSGKSTMINDILSNSLMNHFYDSRLTIGQHKEITGLENINKPIIIDQSAIGRTPRSNPATYTGIFADIRKLFAELPESKARGYEQGRFSFNVAGGRCETCEGDGVKKVVMNFLPDVYVTCEDCKGTRYNRETLEITYKGKNIADILAMSVQESVAFFESIPVIHRRLTTLNQVGLGYIHLGQSATTLSGGEAQRIKLATELSKVSTGKTLYILDEPTTGLHPLDVKLLLEVLQKLVDKGNTVLVIEHNLDIVKCSDWIVDMGPEGGEAGGEIIAMGTPEQVAKNKNSYTGFYLKEVL